MSSLEAGKGMILNQSESDQSESGNQSKMAQESNGSEDGKLSQKGKVLKRQSQVLVHGTSTGRLRRQRRFNQKILKIACIVGKKIVQSPATSNPLFEKLRLWINKQSDS